MLDVLKEEKIKATFFVLGNHFPGGKANPANKTSYSILDREKAEGHYIASHTYEHLAHAKLSQEQMSSNITKSLPLLKDYLSPILRLPYGDGSFRSKNPETQRKNDMVMATVKSAGFKHVGWDIDTNDWDVKKRANLLSDTLKQICETQGGIILFHDIQKNTVEHLKGWIDAIRAEGHSFVGMEHFVPEVANHTPSLKITWDSSKVKITPKELHKNLQDGSPSVEVMTGQDAINITVFMLQNGEDKIVAKRVQEELAKAAVS